MRRSRGIIYVVALSVVSTGTLANACHIIVYTQAEINEAHLQLYKREVRSWDRDATKFDLKSPRIGELLSSERFFDSELEKWKSHPSAFEHNHPFFWQVLDGDWLYHKKHPFPPLSSVPPPQPPFWVPGPSVPDVPPNHSDDAPPSGPHGSPIPEPSAAVLMLTGLILSVVGVGRRRAVAMIWAMRKEARD